MTFLKLLLSSSIMYIIIMAMASPMDNEESKIERVETDKESKITVRSVLNTKSSNISDYVLPIRYNIKIMLDNNNFYGICKITLNISYAKRYISFYTSDSMIITTSTLKKHKITINQTIPTYRVHNIYSNTLEIHFDDVILRGMYDLYIEYGAPIRILSESFKILYINKDEEIEWLIATGIPRRNRYQTKQQQIFPYWDKPELRITFIISIMHYSKYKALSNMPIRNSELTNDNMIWTYFNATPLISMDSVAFLVSGFRQIILSNETIRSSIWFRPQSESHLEFARTIIFSTNVYMRNRNILRRALKRKSFISYESKVDHVAIPDLRNEIKQIMGFIFYREADITYNEVLDPVAYKTIIARLIARGMVQKYIGNLFKPTSLWRHTWLNEGFNIFYHAYIIDMAVANSRMMDLFVVQAQHELLYLNTYVVINSTVEYNNKPEIYFYSSLSHIKGSIIWRMLERIMPKNKLIQGLNKYLNNQLRKPEATTADHLWNFMRSEMIQFYPKYDFNIKETIDSWIMQTCPFELEVMQNYSGVYVSAQFYNKLDEKHYHIPITYTTESKLDFTITWTNFFWLSPLRSKQQINLEKNEWIIFNLQQAGYYRVHYDTANWRKIAQYLNSEKYSNIHVLNRAQIINDAFHFAIEKKLEFSVFWNLIFYLAQEEDYIAWYPMFKAFEILSNIFPFLDFYPEFKDVLRFAFMHNITSKYGNLYDEKNITDHTKSLKQELAKWECIINEKLCEEKSMSHLIWHLANPEENKLLPGWKRWTYCNGLKTADRYTWNKVFDTYINGNDKILECLAYSKNSEIIIYYLEAIIPHILFKCSHNASCPQFESIEQAYTLTTNMFLSVIKRPKYILKSLLSNYKSIRHGHINDIVTLSVIINNAYSKGQLNKIMEFVKKEKNSIISIVHYKTVTRLSEIKKQINYFRSLFNN